MGTETEIAAGMRVEIAKADGSTLGGLSLHDPHPEHIGKQGTIVEVDEDDGMPKIQLDDGVVLYGYECWWRHLTPPMESRRRTNEWEGSDGRIDVCGTD